MDSEDVYRLKNLLFTGCSTWENEYQLMCKKYNLNFIKDGILISWITDESLDTTKDKSDSYYIILKNMIDASFKTMYEYWTNEVVKNWITIFVQKKYPWFLCSIWNKYSEEYLQFLLEQSLSQFHVSNLFQINKNHSFSYFWNSSFWKNNEQVTVFFKRKGRFMKRELRSLIKYLASNLNNINNYYVDNIKESIIKSNTSLFKIFIEEFYKTEPCPCALIYWINGVTSLNNVNLLEWWISNYKFKFTHEEWYELFVNVHPYHLTHKLDKNYRSYEKTETLQVLLNALKENNINNPKIWQDLSIYVENEHSIFDIFAISNQGYSLIDFYFNELKQSVARTLQEDAHLDEPDNFFKTIPFEQLFQSIEKQNMSTEAWTPLTNAIRWGNGSTVSWLINKGSSIHTVSYTNNLRMSHNLLSLSMYNSDETVLQTIINHDLCKPYLKKWLSNGIVDIIVGITRPWIPTCFAFKKLQILHQTFGLNPYKEIIIPTLCRYLKINNTNELCNSNLIKFIGNIPGKLSSEYVYEIIYSNKQIDIHYKILNSLVNNGMYNLPKLYSLILASNAPNEWSLAIENILPFKKEITSITIPQKMQILKFWILRVYNPIDIRFIVNKMINFWNWNLNSFSTDLYLNNQCNPIQLLNWFYELMIFKFSYILDYRYILADISMNPHYQYLNTLYDGLLKLSRAFSVMTRFLKRKEKELHKDVHTKRKRMIYQMVTYPGKRSKFSHQSHILEEGSNVYQRMLECFS